MSDFTVPQVHTKHCNGFDGEYQERDDDDDLDGNHHEVDLALHALAEITGSPYHL